VVRVRRTDSRVSFPESDYENNIWLSYNLDLDWDLEGSIGLWRHWHPAGLSDLAQKATKPTEICFAYTNLICLLGDPALVALS
jgi:hypothetical protein